MSYDLLRGLYLGSAANADTTTTQSRRLLHVRTDLDALVPKLVAAKLDVVVTGNPGDGKSHLIRNLADRDRLGGAEVELDLSSVDESSVLERWRGARGRSRPFILCANEGPLTSLLPALRSDPTIGDAGRELADQIGRLVVSRPADLPARPDRTVLIDLADRNVVDPKLIESALCQVCLPDFFPDSPRGRDTSAGQNLLLLSSSSGSTARLAALLAAAGRRCTEHVGFRQVWAAISYAICAAKSMTTLHQELSRMDSLLGLSPLDNLARAQGQGPLLRAFRDFADPASWPSPQLDEDLWSNGAPMSGSWDVEFDERVEAPAVLWAAGSHRDALERFRSIKRMVAIFHTAGEALVRAVVSGDRDGPTATPDDELRDALLLGIRRLYLDPAEEAAAPAWLRAGMPLWVSHTYQDVPAGGRPHVAVTSLDEADFEIRRPCRAPWLDDALGPPPELVWLAHRPSGVALRVDPELFGVLRRATTSSGPVAAPDTVPRFLSRLSGWEERTAPRGGHMAVLERPRGGLVAASIVREDGVALCYGGSA